MSELVQRAEGELHKTVAMMHDAVLSVGSSAATPQSNTEADAARVGTIAIRLTNERRAEAERLGHVAAAVKHQLASLKFAIHQLSDDVEADLDEELRALNQRNVALGQHVIALYDEAVAIAGGIEDEVLSEDVGPF